jgi:flagellar basal-body rod protein FlgF
VKPPVDDLVKGPDGLFRLKTEGEVAPADASVTLKSGALEGSNVNVAKTLVNMIELARQYEMQINVIKASEENADAAAQMTQLG